MRTMPHIRRGRAVLAVVLLVLGTGRASVAGELPGNLFHQYSVPLGPNVGIAINNPQNMGGGNWVGGSTSQYPVYGPSPVLDGSGTSVWNAGVFSGGGMCNVGITQGYYTDYSGNTFVNSSFGAIDTIRIYADNYLNSAPDNWWIKFPQQIEIGYTTAGFNPGNGYSYNSGALGALPGTYNPDFNPNTAGIATITAVNGVAPTSATSNNPAYGAGWVNLNGDFTQGLSIINPSSSSAYVDLSVVIPAGATSICVSFGQDNSSTGNPGGLAIAGIQAALTASSFTWTGSTSNTWSLAGSDANWSSPSQAYAEGSLVTFDNTGTNPNINVASAVQPFSVTFNNSSLAYTFSGAAISGAGSVLLSSSAGSVTFNNANTYTGGTVINGGTLVLGNSAGVQNSTVTLNAANGLAFRAGLGTASLGGLGGSANFVLDDQSSNPVAVIVGSNNANTAYSGAMSGDGSLTKVGNGTLVLTGTSSYSGGTAVNAGILQIGNGGVNGTVGTGAYAIASGATLRIYPATLAAPIWSNIAGAGTLELNCGGEVDWGTPALSSTGFTGTLQVDTGRIDATPSVLGGATAVVINNGAQFLAFDGTSNGSPYTFTQNFSINGMGWGEGGQNYGALRVAGMNAIFSGSMTLTGNAGLYTQNFGNDPLTVSGPISDGGQGYSLAIYAQGGNITLSGSNTYSGGTVLNTGTLVLGSNRALGTGGLAVNNGTVDLHGFSPSIAGLSGAAGTIITSSVTGPVTLTVSPASGIATFGGKLQDGSGQLSLNLNGAGSLWLTGTNTYTGGTTLNGGTLAVTNAASLGNSNGGLAIGPATLEIAGSIPDNRSISLTDPRATIQVDAPFTFSYGSNLSGTGGLSLTGGGTLILGGSNSYSAGTTVSGGTLQLGNSSALGTGGLTANQGTVDLNGHSAAVPSLSGLAGTITNSSSTTLATLTVSPTATNNFGGTLQDGSGQLALVKSGAGTLILSASNAYSGGTTISQGTLQVNQPNSGNPLGSGPITLSGGVLKLLGTQNVQETVAAGGWNVKLIASSAAASPQAGTNSNQGGWTWYEQGAPGSSQGLPTSGLITSQYGPANVQFQLQPYAANNVVQLQGGQSQTLTLGNPAKFQTLQFLQSGQSGGTYTAQLNFSDSSTYTLSNSYLDWTSGTAAGNPFALTNVGLVGNNSSWGGFYTGQLSLFENDFTLPPGDQAKTLNSITLYNAGGGALMFFALSGNALVPSAPSYANAVNVAADSTIDVRDVSPSATLGSVSIGGNMLTVTGDAGMLLQTGSVTLTGNATFAPDAGITLTLGSLNDGGMARTVTMAGSGAVTLTAAAASLVDGTQVAISAGTLNSNNAAALGSLAQVGVAAGATLSLGASQTLGALSGAGSVLLNGNPLTVGSGNNLSSIFSGVISDGSGAASLIKSGSGTLTLSGPNTYSGGTTIGGGVLEISLDQNLGAGAGAITLDTGTLRVTGTAEVDINRATTLVASGGAFEITNSSNGGVVLAAIVVGPGQLTKTGSGLLTLSASNVYSGGTTVVGGVLRLGDDNALGSGSLAVNSNGTLDLHGYGPTVTSLTGDGIILNSSSGTSNASPLTVTAGGAFAGTIQDGGLGGDAPTSLILSGGVLTLSGTDYYSGGTIVSGGTLVLDTSTALLDGTSLTVGLAGNLFGPTAAGSPVVADQFFAASPGAAITSVPEPGTLALLVAGAVMLAIYRKPRQK